MEGLIEPQIEERFGIDCPDRTTLILPLIKKKSGASEKSPKKSPEKSPKKSPEKSPKSATDKQENMEIRRQMVIKMIKADPCVSRAYMAKELGITDRQVRTVLEQLKASGMIYGRSGKWVIIDS